MNTKFLKKTGIVLASVLGAAYVLFLAAPLIANPIIKNYIPQINEEIKKASGFNSKLEGVKVVTTPKLTAGLKVGGFSILLPDNREIINAEDFQVKMSLLPLILGKVEVDVVSLKNLDVKLNLNPDGSFELEKYLPEPVETSVETETQTEPVQFPLKLSNKLPDIRVGGVNINFIDSSNGKSYKFVAGKTDITDFVLNKGIKISSSGSFNLVDREQFTYKLRVNNKIMPDLDLNELVFNPQPAEEKHQTQEDIKINVLEILKGLYNYQITANLNGDITLTKEGNHGYLNADNLSLISLPASDLALKFSGHKTDINANLYTAKNEISTVKGVVKSGKNPNIDMNFKSQAEIANIVKILNSIALTFNIKDLQTLTANGKLDADFNIKSNLKTVNSNGYLKIPAARVYYGLYQIGIDNINADVALNNNNIDIKNIGFSILNQPLKFYGKITQDAVADLHLLAENLSIKGLIVACGQSALLKENNVNSGNVTLKADITGRLDKIQPVAKVILSGLDIKNVPSNTTLKLPKTNVDIVADTKGFAGTATSEGVKVINPAASVSVPKVMANIREDVIEITQTPVAVEKINFNVSGKIKNYLTEKILLDFGTTGDIKSTLSGDINMLKQTLNLVFAAPQNSTIIVPMFDKSKMTFNGNISIAGNMMNPILSGSVNVPSLNIPEIPVTMDNLNAKLNGPILLGTASVKNFASGGIAAQDITSDFSMKGENFYLTNLKGTAFDGKIGGNIIYNLSNAKTAIDFKGEGMNAEKAIHGAAGIKNALSGTLSFNTKMTLVVLDYNDMMKSLKGNLLFKVSDGAFGTIGRLENFFNAGNISGNTILKSTAATLSNLAGIKNTAKFSYITGDLSFSDGWANLKSIKSTGESLAYFVTGKYNLINGTTNVVVLGRMDAVVVKQLGPIGDLSAEKLLGAIPKFGPLTASIVNTMTTDPKGENIAAIPALTGGSGSHKDFKVIFNGGLESTNSIKSFKWLTKVDTSAIQPVSAAETLKSLKSAVNEDLTNTVKGVADTISNQKDLIKNSAEELKNLFKF